MRTSRNFLLMVLSALAVALGLWTPAAPGCCAAGPAGQAVLNADQTVIIIWDAANQVQHFIRKATFASEADDFGFLVPTPSRPELAESGNEAFPLLQSLTAPPPRNTSGSGGGLWRDTPPTGSVTVLEEKCVAGFNAAVLEATTADALVNWLKNNGYAYSAAVEAWAQPYIAAQWKFTALKVAKREDAKQDKNVSASALRISFKTDRPLFPYREPNDPHAVETLNAKERLLRIYFIAESRYRGELTAETPWTGKPMWSNRVDGEFKRQILEHLALPQETGPADWWLTEFEDRWPYRAAPADLYFSRDKDQSTLSRRN